ncbi:MAG: cellulose biosynthesis protein BcsS [Myxococcota bacterium]
MIATLALAALAEPPRAEITAGWSGNVDQSYGSLVLQPALLRSVDASVVLRATVSTMYYTFDDSAGTSRVESPGTSIGPGFVYTPKNLALGMSIGIGARRSTVKLGDDRDRRVELDATLSGDLYWRPGQRAQLYGTFSFNAVGPYLWARSGATVPVAPFSGRSAPVSLWLGAEATSVGTFDDRVLEVGPVAELPVRELGAVFSLRGGVALDERDGFDPSGLSFGAGVYWSY